MNRFRLSLLFVALLIVGVALGYSLYALLAPQNRVATVRQGAGYGEALIGGPFTLTDQDGRTRSDSEFRGRLMLVNFGFTNCPDVCPLGLQLMTDALERLGPSADQVQPIFITVDPPRDTPAVLKSYMEHFSERLIGFTGTPEQIADVAREYRVYYKAQGTLETDPNYSVDHSAFIYLMGRDGKFITHFRHDMDPDRVAEAIRQHL